MKNNEWCRNYFSDTMWRYGDSKHFCDCSIYIFFWQHGPSKMAVFVYVHGGSNRVGMGAMLRGDILAAFGNITVVNFNYRLGSLGNHMSRHIIFKPLLDRYSTFIHRLQNSLILHIFCFKILLYRILCGEEGGFDGELWVLWPGGSLTVGQGQYRQIWRWPGYDYYRWTQRRRSWRRVSRDFAIKQRYRTNTLISSST